MDIKLINGSDLLCNSYKDINENFKEVESKIENIIEDNDKFGDMKHSVYDPNNKRTDIYNIENMTESDNKKILTNQERINIEESKKANHEHNNKSILDEITKEKIDKWDAGGDGGDTTTIQKGLNVEFVSKFDDMYTATATFEHSGFLYAYTDGMPAPPKPGERPAPPGRPGLYILDESGLIQVAMPDEVFFPDCIFTSKNFAYIISEKALYEGTYGSNGDIAWTKAKDDILPSGISIDSAVFVCDDVLDEDNNMSESIYGLFNTSGANGVIGVSKKRLNQRLNFDLSDVSVDNVDIAVLANPNTKETFVYTIKSTNNSVECIKFEPNRGPVKVANFNPTNTGKLDKIFNIGFKIFVRVATSNQIFELVSNQANKSLSPFAPVPIPYLFPIDTGFKINSHFEKLKYSELKKSSYFISNYNLFKITYNEYL